MILVDSSVWIDHLRHGNEELSSFLRKVEVLTHPFVIGELSCGNLKNRDKILTLLSNLPAATVAEHTEVLELIETRKLMGQGLGWVDAHLLASAMLSGALLWTEDRKLRALSAALGIHY